LRARRILVKRPLKSGSTDRIRMPRSGTDCLATANDGNCADTEGAATAGTSLHCALLLGGAAFLFEQAGGDFARQLPGRRYLPDVANLLPSAEISRLCRQHMLRILRRLKVGLSPRRGRARRLRGSNLKTPNHSVCSAGRSGADDKPSLISRYDIFAIAAVPSYRHHLARDDRANSHFDHLMCNRLIQRNRPSTRACPGC
jgi:hypothetical protein